MPTTVRTRRRSLLDHFPDKIADRVHGDGDGDRRQQFADEPIGSALLPEFGDAVLERQQLRVTARANGRERLDSFTEASRLRSDVFARTHADR
jgi:hypothetical protein